MNYSPRKLLETGDVDFKEVIKHSFWAFGLIIVAAMVQFLFDVVLARMFGAHGTGVFYLSFSVLAMVALAGRLGLDRAVIRFLPPMLVNKEVARAKGLNSAAVRTTLYITIPLAVALFILSPVLANRVFNEPDIVGYLRLFALGVPGFSLVYIYAGILRAMKRTRLSVFIERIAIHAFGIIFLLLLGTLFGLSGLFWGFVLSIYIAVALGVIVSREPFRDVKSPIKFSRKTLLLVSLPLLFVIFSNQLINQVNVLALGALSTSENVGIFNISLKISLLMSMALTGVNTIMATKISEHYANSKNLQALVSKATALTIAIALPIFIIMVAAPDFLLSLFGDEFIAGKSALVILAIGQLFNISTGPVTYLLAMTGYEKSLAITIGSVLLLNIALSLALIPPYGIVGASLAVGISVIAKNLIQLLLAKRYLNVWSLPFKALRNG